MTFFLLESALTIIKRLTGLISALLQENETPWIYGVYPNYSEENYELKSALPCERDLESNFRKCFVIDPSLLF